jgi:hypothetical protein
MENDRVPHIMVGVATAMLHLRMCGLNKTEAKIAMRAAIFMMEEFDRCAGMSDAEVDTIGQQLAPEIVAFIKQELAAKK